MPEPYCSGPGISWGEACPGLGVATRTVLDLRIDVTHDLLEHDVDGRSPCALRSQGCRLSDPGGRFLGGKPDCIDAGNAQFDRVEVTNSTGRHIATRDWIAASLWSTDRVRRDPVSLLWDPPGGGDGLGEEEAEDHAQAMRRQRDAAVAARLGNPESAARWRRSPPRPRNRRYG